LNHDKETLQHLGKWRWYLDATPYNEMELDVVMVQIKLLGGLQKDVINSANISYSIQTLSPVPFHSYF
jgi:hypothetical protein